MNIVLADNSGFCFGVRRAVQQAMEAAHEDLSTSTLGPIIHNPQVVEKLAELGIHSIERLDDFSGDRIVIRSHGVAPDIYIKSKEKGIEVIDATCPYVKKIQRKAAQCHEKGIPLIIVGESQHPETQGINGWHGHNAYIINSISDLGKLPNMSEACVVAQTTTSREKWDLLIAHLSERIEGLEVFDSICDATKNRQVEAIEVSKRCDIVFVIGGRNSSNTRKLYEICKQHCDHSYHIESVKDIPDMDYGGFHELGIISGASTPDWIIKEVFVTMSDIERVETTEQIVEPEVKEEASEETTAQPQEAEVVEEGAKSPESTEDSGDANFMEDVEKSMVTIRPGTIITGKVVTVNESEVCVNIGYKADGIIPQKEFSTEPDANPAELVKEGDEIEVEVIRVKDDDGNVLLSKKNVEARKNWKKLLEDYENGDCFEGVGKQAVKGGLIATINGVRAFVPASHLDVRYVNDITEYVGKSMPLKILEVEKHRRRVVASHKQFLLDEEKKEKEKLWDALEEGLTVKGIVRRLTNFGAFVDIGGLDGLVHVTDLAWGRVEHPKDVVSIDEEIDVVILKVDRERERVSLGYKQTKPKPWDIADDKYPVNSIITGRVVRIVPFGAFVEIEPGLDGLVHISQIADRRIEKVEDVLELGQEVQARVLDVNPNAKRISLSIRDLIEGANNNTNDDYYDEEESSSVLVDLSQYQGEEEE